EITAGLNWTPHPNLIVRPEVRWDWYEADGAVATYPYDAGDLDHQFIFGCDMILTF
ncbi:MAG: porin, partial [Planctomycetota bacterium]